MLEIENINSGKRLCNISFKAYQGEILGIVGLMGAGRTELMRAICGAFPRSSGKIKIEGKEVDIKNPQDAIKVGIGYLTEDRKKDGLFLNLSISENIISASYSNFSNNGFINTQKVEAAVERYTKKISIKMHSSAQTAGTLSGGNQQKVMLAKWLCNEAKILIFDEPTRGIDVKSKYEIYQLMYELVAAGITIIMISSEMPEVIGMSDRILVMNEGCIAGELDKKEATQEKILQYEMMEVDRYGKK